MGIDIYKDLNFNEIMENIRNKKYRCIGIGTGRRVYDLNNGYVIKVAINQKGIAQNEAEFKIALADDSGIFAYIPKISGNYKYLIMEKAARIWHISVVRRYFRVSSNRELLQTEELQRIAKRHSIELKDLDRSANWGYIRGRPVIIDYGFTSDVRRKYYTTGKTNKAGS